MKGSVRGRKGKKKAKKTQEGFDRYEIRLGGSGGQGIITAARVFAEAISEHTRKYVCQSQSYGPEARGGASKADIVISNEPIDYPKATKPDLLLAMTQMACDAYFSDLKPEGVLVVDSGLVEQIPTSRSIGIPFTEIARKEVGRELAANMVALGALTCLTKVVSAKGVEQTLLAKVPKETLELNQKAFRAGIDAVKKLGTLKLPEHIEAEEEL